MEIEKACQVFESHMNEHVEHIERCSTGIGNYVFVVATPFSKYILRCSKQSGAYNESIHWLTKLQVCNIPIPKIISHGQHEEYEYIVLTYAEGKDIGDIYINLTDEEKKQIAKEVMAIQRNVSKLVVDVSPEWSWSAFVTDMLDRAYELISINNYFDVAKVIEVRKLQKEMQTYIFSIRPITYLDDISTKNLLIQNGHVSGVIDIDWIGIGDILTFVALTKVALLNMEFDTKYVDYLIDELNPSTEQYRAFIFYCLLFCVDFMGERGNQFLDKIVPVNQQIIDRLNRLYDEFMVQWAEYKL